MVVEGDIVGCWGEKGGEEGGDLGMCGMRRSRLHCFDVDRGFAINSVSSRSRMCM